MRHDKNRHQSIIILRHILKHYPVRMFPIASNDISQIPYSALQPFEAEIKRKIGLTLDELSRIGGLTAEQALSFIFGDGNRRYGPNDPTSAAQLFVYVCDHNAAIEASRKAVEAGDQGDTILLKQFVAASKVVFSAKFGEGEGLQHGLCKLHDAYVAYLSSGRS